MLQQLFHIKHTTTITDYNEKFTDLFEQLKAYNPNPDKLYFTTRFIDGLRKDIRSVVLVARPQDLDSACTLALLQEEALDQGGCKEFKCSEASPFSRTATIKGALPLPPPPCRPPAPPATIDDKRAAPKHTSIDDKLSTLRSYRRARGLCIRCGDKWAPGHRCAPVPQIHALQEVWDLYADAFQEGAATEPAKEEQANSEQAFMLLSSAAVTGSTSPRTMQLQGSLSGRDLRILIDSGSSHSFLSSTVAATIPNVQKLSSPMSVIVADGSTIICSAEIQYAKWVVQGHSFHSTLRILQLGTYDMIVGMDWLEAFSPMKID